MTTTSFSGTSPPPAPARMPGLAVWAYILSFLFSPLGIFLSVRTLRKYPDHRRARRLAYVSLVIGTLYLVGFTLARIVIR